jgi:peptide/nickel transport system substrate-binding protein
MYHAIDPEKLIVEHNNISNRIVSSQFVTSHIFGYNPNISRLPYNITLAKEYMKKSGYQEGFSITLDCYNSTSHIDICEEIAEQLSLINISVEINPLPYEEYYQYLYFKNTSFYITAFSPLNAEGLIDILLYTSDMQEGTGVWNYGNYSNTEVDNLADELKYCMDSTRRKMLLQEIFSIAMDDVAWIPLFSTRAFYSVNNTFQWTPRPSLYVLFSEFTIQETTK